MVSLPRLRQPALASAVALCAAFATAAGAVPPASAAAASTVADATPSAAVASAVATGTLPDGATWQAEVPANWTGELVLFSHGFRGGSSNPAWDASFDPTARQLIARGYAVASSSYATTGWALGSAVQDQLDTLAAVQGQFGKASRVIAVGRSMGGLITSLLAEVPGAGIDGAVSTCGLVGGGVALNNYQLDAAYAAAQLLLPGQDVQLTGFTAPDQSQKTIAALKAALQEATMTAEGRARIALVAGLLNTPTQLDGVDPQNREALAAAQAQLVLATLPTVIERRYTIVDAAGGDSGWNAGVDYAALVRASPQREQIRRRPHRGPRDADAERGDHAEPGWPRLDAQDLDPHREAPGARPGHPHQRGPPGPRGVSGGVRRDRSARRQRIPAPPGVRRPHGPLQLHGRREHRRDQRDGPPPRHRPLGFGGQDLVAAGQCRVPRTRRRGLHRPPPGRVRQRPGLDGGPLEGARRRPVTSRGGPPAPLG